MSRRKRPRSRRQVEREVARRREEARAGFRARRWVAGHRAYVAVAALLAALVLIAIASGGLSPRQDPDRCFAAGSAPDVQAYGVEVFLQVGNATGGGVQFIRVPTGMGVESACSYAIHTIPDDPATRGPFWTPLNVRSPSAHAYTLGDVFATWGRWLSDRDRAQPYAPIAFGPDRLSYYRGTVQVEACPGAALQSVPWGAGVCQPVATFGDTPLNGNVGYYVVLHDPLTNTTNAYG